MTNTNWVVSRVERQAVLTRRYSMAGALMSFSILSLFFVYAAQQHNPLLYLQIIAEDQFGEYSSTCMFVVASAIFLKASFGAAGLRRVVTAAASICLLLIAGEEVSWGQRLLGLSTPEALAAVNQQGETTLHNIGPLQTFPFHELVGLALAVTMGLAWLKHKGVMHWVLDAAPLPSVVAWPIFAVSSSLLILQPFVKGDEVSELFLATTCLVWACLIGKTKAESDVKPVMLGAAALILISFAFGAILASLSEPASFAWRANITATRDYPSLGKIKQADDLFHQIMRRPALILPETQFNHGRVHRLAADDRPTGRSLVFRH